MKTAVALVSGGMDSVTLLAYAAVMFDRVIAVSFDYGQRHVRELACAQWQAEHRGASFQRIKLPVGDQLTGSSLTDPAVPVPHGHYSEETMRQTVVPGRNAMMISAAWGIAATASASVVATAVHAGDHFIYPDCRPEFIASLNHSLRLGTEGHRLDEMRIWAPFLWFSKIEILRLGDVLGVDYSHSWTCYEGGDIACGQCGACRERLEAFEVNAMRDPLKYA